MWTTPGAIWIQKIGKKNEEGFSSRLSRRIVICALLLLSSLVEF